MALTIEEREAALKELGNYKPSELDLAYFEDKLTYMKITGTSEEAIARTQRQVDLLMKVLASRQSE